MACKKYLWLAIVIGIVLLLSACDDKSSCNSTCENPTVKTFWCDPPYECELDSMRCRNPDCPSEVKCKCPEEVVQDDPVVPHLQLIVLEGSVFYDQTADGERNEGEGTVGGIELNVVDKSCKEDCAPAASTTTDQEGGYRLEFVHGQGVTYIFEFNWVDWPDINDYRVGNDETQIDSAIAAAGASEDADDALDVAMDVPIVLSNSLTPAHESLMPYLDHVNADPLLTMSLADNLQEDGKGDEHPSDKNMETNDDVIASVMGAVFALLGAFNFEG